MAEHYDPTADSLANRNAGKREESEYPHTNRLLCLWLLAQGIGLAVLVIAAFQRPTVAAGISTASVALLSALMCFAAGAFLGLLFGVPRQNKIDGEKNSIEPNNNLEQVSDWLTKMIVGITLVQFGTIVQKVKVVARQINDAMLGCPPQCTDNYAMGLAVIGFFAASGFLMMFLWSRIYLLKDANELRANIEKGNKDLEKLREKNAVQEKPEDLLGKPAGVLEKSGALLKSLVSGGATVVEAATAAATASRLDAITEVKPGLHVNDPWKGVFGGKSKDIEKARELTAEVKPVPRSDYCSVRLTVRTLDHARPLTGSVKFFLHDTFPEPVKTVPVENGVATLMVASWGAFTVGVLADNDATKLELDLSGVMDAPADWRGR